MTKILETTHEAGGSAVMSKSEHDAEGSSTVQCIMCLRDYDRHATDRFSPLGVFEKYCLCNICVYGQEEKPS